MRRTRILATLGPVSSDPKTIHALIAAGADAFRLNFSHGTVATHTAAVKAIRAAAADAGRPIAVLQDLGGPKIRIGPLDAPLPLETGQVLRIDRGAEPTAPGAASCAFDALFASVEAGHRLLIDDGRIEVEVTEARPDHLTTRVVTGGTLGAHKGINVPGVPLKTSAITPKDAEDLRAGIGMGVDLIALSFVQSPDDVRQARALAAAAGAPDVPIIAKIEKPLAVDRIEDIVEAADGVMVARGDLGIEVPLETLPAVQRRIVVAARRRAKCAILATQVLESMIEAPRPTRAEVTDAAHAVDERVDAIMLAGETAVGRHPVEAVETLGRIILDAERTIQDGVVVQPAGIAPSGSGDHALALCEAAVTLAERAGAAAIVAVTEAGATARLLAGLRPAALILAATPAAATATRLALTWGVVPVITGDARRHPIREVLVSRGLIAPGAVLVYVSIRPSLGHHDANVLRVERA